MHPTEDDLARFAFDGGGPAIASHVATCAECARTVEWIKTLDDGFRDDEVWELSERVASAPARLPESLRELARQVEIEDADAERLLASMLKTPAAVAWRDLTTERSYRTAGVVRRLLRAANESCEREPLDALTMADTAAGLAGVLDNGRYPQSVITSLRATAAKERANALRFLGRYDEALAALDEAERAFEDVPGAPLGRTTVTYIRAGILVERGEYAQALPLARESAREFRRAGDTDRYMRARHLEGHIQFYLRDVRAARTIYLEILAHGMRENESAVDRSRVTNTRSLRARSR